VSLVKSDVSEARITSIITGTKFGEQVTGNIVTWLLNLVTLMMEAIRSFGTSVLRRVTWRNISEGGILHSHRRENLKSYIALTGWTL
jgi:hypothetical protein